MKDMMAIIYNQLIENPTILSKVNKRIKFYEAPETMETPYIVIRPVDVSYPVVGGSDKELSLRFTYQLDVLSSNRNEAKAIQQAIKQELRGIGFGQLSGGLDDYFSETKEFIDARRYRKTTSLYDTDY